MAEEEEEEEERICSKLETCKKICHVKCSRTTDKRATTTTRRQSASQKKGENDYHSCSSLRPRIGGKKTRER